MKQSNYHIKRGKTFKPRKGTVLSQNTIYRSLEDFLQIHSIGVKSVYGGQIISGIRIA